MESAFYSTLPKNRSTTENNVSFSVSPHEERRDAVIGSFVPNAVYMHFPQKDTPKKWCPIILLSHTPSLLHSVQASLVCRAQPKPIEVNALGVFSDKCLLSAVEYARAGVRSGEMFLTRVDAVLECAGYDPIRGTKMQERSVQEKINGTIVVQ